MKIQKINELDLVFGRGNLPSKISKREQRVIVHFITPKTRVQLIQLTSLSKNTVINALNDLLGRKLIRPINSNPLIYELTNSGKIALTNLKAEGILSLEDYGVRVHDYSICAKLLGNRNSKLIYNFTEKRPAIMRINLDFFSFKESVTVSVYPNNVYFNLPPIYAPSPEVALSNLGELVDAILCKLEECSGLRFVKEGVTAKINSLHIAFPLHPLAIEAYKKMHMLGKVSVRGRKFHFDFSDGLPELESIGPRHAISSIESIIRFCDLIAEPKKLNCFRKIN